MDWIEEAVERWKTRLRRSTLRQAMVSYLLFTVLVIIFALVATWEICNSWMQVICQVNEIQEDYVYVGNGSFALYYDDDVIRVSKGVISMDEEDTRLYNAISLIKLICIPVYSIGGIILVSFLYYRNKLTEPMRLLKKEMDYIRRNDLSFSCYYDSIDEMGDVCKAMDTMRLSLIKNQKNMWELMEEQRKVNAAFAHDLRTPLTVISGYVDMLMEHYPKGAIAEERMLEVLSSIQGQTVRMREFSKTMKEMHGFETLVVNPKLHTGGELEREIRTITEGLMREVTPSIEVIVKQEKETFYYDENIVMEVLGNLLSNALRYGRKKILVQAEQQGEKLTIYVKDDGRGMTSEELYKADSPYYSDKRNSEGEGGEPHFGLGLTICKTLCKKHGGELSLFNSVEGGAIVCAEFLI